MTDVEQADNLRYLYDKRLELFNKRRDHEWKIFFGVITLLVALDAALITHNIRFDYGWQRITWTVQCFVLCIACLGFQRDLQKRNRADRLIINELSIRLSNLIGLPNDSHIRDGIETAYDEQTIEQWDEPLSNAWSFSWQAVVLITVTIASILMPSFLAR